MEDEKVIDNIVRDAFDRTVSHAELLIKDKGATSPLSIRIEPGNESLSVATYLVGYFESLLHSLCDRRLGRRFTSEERLRAFPSVSLIYSHRHVHTISKTYPGGWTTHKTMGDPGDTDTSG